MKKPVISLLSTIVGVITGIGITSNIMENTIKKRSDMSAKHLTLYLMMNEWVKVKQEGKNLAEYFEKNGYRKIAVYGMSYAGETFLNELSKSDIEVAYAIDKNAESIHSDINVVTMERDLQEVDVVVVTAITFYNEIKKELKEKLECPIVSLEDILYEI